jgi:hypothetical protein
MAIEGGRERFDLPFEPEDFGLPTIDALQIEGFTEEWARTCDDVLTVFPPNNLTRGIEAVTFQVVATSGGEKREIEIDAEIFFHGSCQARLISGSLQEQDTE